MSPVPFDMSARATHAGPAAFIEGHPRLALALGILVAALLGQVSALATATAVLSTGAFFDTDDAMRMVQVRDLIAGQGWFDMTATRLDPPIGVFMHWSRIVDMPVVALMKGFALFAEPILAERLARLMFPFLLILALFALLVPLCERLSGPGARWPALAAAFLLNPAKGQFEPGRIDHHAPQIVLLVVCVLALTQAIVSGRSSRAGWAGAAMAVSLGISIENVPFFAPVFAWLALLWVLRGRDVTAMLAWFAAGLAGTLPLVYAGVIAPSRWLLVAPDALSLAQGVALLAGAAYLGGLCLAALRLPDSRRVRVVVASLSGLVVALALARSFPVLIQSPFASLDPLLRTGWLDHVDEAQPLLRMAKSDPFWTVGVLVPVLIGLYGMARDSLRSTEWRRRIAWLLLAMALVGGLAASCAMVRTLSATLTLAVPGVLAAALSLRRMLLRRSDAFSGPLALIACLLVASPTGWAIASDRLRQGVAQLAWKPAAPPRDLLAQCTAPDTFARLADLPPGLVMADPDLGSFILAHTHHDVLAGAYHRNAHGMRVALETFAASSDGAAARMRSAGARYLVVCNAASATFAKTSGSLEAALAAMSNLPGLRHLAAQNSAIDVYTVE